MPKKVVPPGDKVIEVEDVELIVFEDDVKAIKVKTLHGGESWIPKSVADIEITGVTRGMWPRKIATLTIGEQMAIAKGIV